MTSSENVFDANLDNKKNKSKFTHNRVIVIVILISMLGIAITATPHWPGDAYSYWILTFTYAVLLAICCLQTKMLSLTFFSGVLFIAFWLKATLGCISGRIIWAEPVGAFQGNALEWNIVSLIASAGAIGCIFTAVLWQNLNCLGVGCSSLKPASSKLYSYTVWILSFLITVAFIIINYSAGLFYAGLQPELQLHWPLRGLIGWFVGVGLALFFLAPLGANKTSERWPVYGFILLMLGSSLLSIGVCSRGSFFILTAPMIMTLVLARQKIEWATPARVIVLFLVFAFGNVVTVFAAQTSRTVFFPEYSKPEMVSTVAQTEGRPWFDAAKHVTRHLTDTFTKLSIDRWLGLEGAMAISSFEPKGLDTLWRASVERRTQNKPDFYTQFVARVPTRDIGKYDYATMPGLFGFMYYSGSLAAVFLGAALATACILVFESTVMLITRNIFLATQVGVYLSMLFIQLGGGGLSQPLTSAFFTLIAALFLGMATLQLFSKPAKI